MRNITLTIPDDLYRKVRVKAAQMDRSVSALVRDYLSGLVQEEEEFQRRKVLQDEILGRIKGFRASDRLSRDQLHER